MPTKLVANCETGEVQEIELTEEEIAEMEKSHVEAIERFRAQEEEAKAKAEARASAAAKLAALGLTAEEIAALS